MKVSKKIRLMSCCGLAIFTFSCLWYKPKTNLWNNRIVQILSWLAQIKKATKGPIAISIARKVKKKFEKLGYTFG